MKVSKSFTMSRYTLGDAIPDTDLFVVLDNGAPTRAKAMKDVTFADDCEIFDGVFHDGVFHGGWFHGGVFRGGVFHDGVFRGGVFHGGVFHGGVFHGGWFHGGEFHDGVFHGGVFHDGVFHDGVFHDGVFRGGWLPIQIQGSRHFVNCPDGKIIRIGCQRHTPEFWLTNFQKIGEENGYTVEQIEEYKMYIDFVTALINRNVVKQS